MTSFEESAPFIEIVRTLTQVALQRDEQRRIDFAGYIANVLAATAATVGGPEELLAGRSGSWEASYVFALIQGTMGEHPHDWMRFRTEPVRVPLNVAELIENGERHPRLLGIDDALAVIDERYSSTDDDGFDTYEAEVGATTARYASGYHTYGVRFTKAVADAAMRCGLPVQVITDIDDCLRSHWWQIQRSRIPCSATTTSSLSSGLMLMGSFRCRTWTSKSGGRDHGQCADDSAPAEVVHGRSGS